MLCCGHIADIQQYTTASTLNNMITNTYVHTVENNSGKEWETIVNIAILMNLIIGSAFGGFHPLSKVAVEEGYKIYCKVIPCEMDTLDKAKDWLMGEMKEIRDEVEQNFFVLFTFANSTFKLVDGIIMHAVGKKIVTVVYQCKAGKGYIQGKKDLPRWVQKGYLIRGQPNRTSTEKNSKWTYMIDTDVTSLLGHSLVPLKTLFSEGECSEN